MLNIFDVGGVQAVLEVPDIPAAAVSRDHQHADLPARCPTQQIHKHYLQVGTFGPRLQHVEDAESGDSNHFKRIGLVWYDFK